MSDLKLAPDEGRKRAVFTFIGGVVGGGILGTLLGGGFFSEELRFAPVSQPEQRAVTFTSTRTDIPKAEALERILMSGQITNLSHTRDLLAFVDSMEPGEFSAQIDEIRSSRRGGEGFDLIQTLFQKWAETDAAAALQYAETLKGKDREAALRGVLPEWASQQPLEALDWVEKNDWNRDFQSVLYVSLQTIANKDPVEAATLVESSDYLRNTGTSMVVDGVFQSIPWFIYGIWAERDLDAATAGVLTISDLSQRTNALHSLARHLASRDPDAAWKWATGLEPPGAREVAMENVIVVQASNGSIDEAISRFITLPPGRSRSELIGTLSSRIAESDPKRAFEFLQEQALGSEVGESFHVIFRQWAKTDPKDALDTILRNLGPGNDQKSALSSLLSMVASQDATLAVDLLEMLNPDQFRPSIQSIATALARKDPTTAIAWADRLPETQLKSSALPTIFAEWARSNPEESCSESLKVMEPDLRRQCIDTALRQWANGNAAEAMAWAVGKLDGAERDTFIPNTLLHAWADQDLDATKEWVLALPNGNLRAECISQITLKMAQHDAASAGAWLNRLPKDEVRDRAVQSFASQVFGSDPEAALSWVESINTGQIRIPMMTDLFQRYWELSPQKAKRWIANSSLPAERKAALLKEAEGK